MDLLQEFFISLGLLSLIALIGAFLSARWKQPTVVGLLLVGALAGPHALGLIKEGEVVPLLGEFGATLLLFSIGVEFSLSKILVSGLRAAALATVVMGILFFAGYESAVLLGLDTLPALVVGACLSFSSTAIFIRLLSAHGLLDQPSVPLLVSMLVIEDIVAVGAIAFFSAIADESGTQTPDLLAIGLSLVFSIVLLGFAYLVLRALLQRLRATFLSIKSDENLVLMALGLCVLLSMLASAIGLSPSIGAFLAGSMVASFSIKDEVERIVHPFLLAFSSFFFISIGLMISPAVLLHSWPAILLLSAVFVVFAFLSVAAVTYLSGMRLDQAILAGAAMATLGEFSLLLAQSSASLVKGIDLVSVMSMVVLISTVISSILLSARLPLADLARSKLPGEMRLQMRSSRFYLNSVLHEFEGPGAFFKQARSLFSALRAQLTLFVVVGLVLLLTRHFLGGILLSWGGVSVGLPAAVLIISLVILSPILWGLLKEFGLLAHAFQAVFMRTHANARASDGRLMSRDFKLGLLLALITLALPLTVDLLGLPNEFHLLVILPIAALVLLLFDMLTHLAGLLASSRRRR